MIEMSALRDSMQGERENHWQVHRSLREATARPGTVTTLPPAAVLAPAPWPAPALRVARALLGVGHTFSVHGENEETFARYLATLTGARLAPANAAHCVLACPYTAKFDVWTLPRIVSLASEGSRKLLVACRLLAEPGPLAVEGGAPEEGIVLGLCGPDIPWQRMLIVDGVVAVFLLQFAARCDAHSLGIGVILVDATGKVSVLPESTRCHWMGHVSGTIATPRHKDAPLAVM